MLCKILQGIWYGACKILGPRFYPDPCAFQKFLRMNRMFILAYTCAHRLLSEELFYTQIDELSWISQSESRKVIIVQMVYGIEAFLFCIIYQRC